MNDGIRLVVTGGGTGGHVYPALEVAREAVERGAQIRYVGSLRGQEGAICQQRGIEFTGFESRALYSLKSRRGWVSLALLIRATGAAKRDLSRRRPDAVFSTGGYSAAPVMAAARSLKVPYVIHESNSVPGRSNRMFAPQASGCTCTFNRTVQLISGAVRTGQPIRKELREAANQPSFKSVDQVVVLGGSQGSEFLSSLVPTAAPLLKTDAQILLASGKNNYDRIAAEHQGVKGLRIVPYLETAELVDAYRHATVAVARSGGTVAEFAMFGLPSVLIPLPTSADDHQLRNAQEFVDFGGAILLEQGNATPAGLAAAMDRWLQSSESREKASSVLKKWDAPDATERIVDIVERAASRHN